MDETDIFISGGGIAGLTAAATLAQKGWRICLADPAVRSGAPQDDTRSTAYLRPACQLLEEAGVWDAVEPHAARLDVLRVVDTTGWPPVERARRDFDAKDLGEETFGWNIPNWITRRELESHLRSLPNVDLRLGVGFGDILVRDREALVTLSDGARIAARLAIAADGRASPLREATGVATRVTRYGQRALAFAVTHPEPHANVSTEIYNKGGAFTLVPLRDIEGAPASAIVWMDDGPRAASLARASAEDLAETATTRCMAMLGPLRVASPVQSWPIVTQVATRLTAPRIALIAEAAHVLPPIGAQGLNTSLADVASLARCISPEDPGAQPGLEAFEAERKRDVAARATAIDLFNRVCKSGASPVQALRRAGLMTLHGLTPLRRTVMRAGMGRPAA